MTWSRNCFLFTCAAAAIRIAVLPAADSHPKETATGFPGWPIALDGIRLEPLPPSEEDRKFAANFPGETAAFTCGGKRAILRWIDRPTRLLHPPSDCLRALGYTIQPKPVTVDADGRHWGAFVATKSDAHLTALTRIYDTGGNSWTDVSAWFWAASSGDSQGPWWSVTLFEDV